MKPLFLSMIISSKTGIPITLSIEVDSSTYVIMAFDHRKWSGIKNSLSICFDIFFMTQVYHTYNNLSRLTEECKYDIISQISGETMYPLFPAWAKRDEEILFVIDDMVEGDITKYLGHEGLKYVFGRSFSKKMYPYPPELVSAIQQGKLQKILKAMSTTIQVNFDFVRGLELHPNGIIKRRGELYKGVPHGEWIEQYSNGKPKYRRHFDENGEFHGVIQNYNTRGELEYEGQWEHGRFMGTVNHPNHSGSINWSQVVHKKKDVLLGLDD